MHALDILAWAGALISWIGTGRYMVEIARGNTRPRLASWIAWATANGVLMFVALLNNNMTAALFDGLAALGNVSVLILSSIKHAGNRPDGVTDWTCLGTACACLLAILVFPELVMLDALLAMAANIVATWPTVRHAWQRPHEEAWELFAANGGANLLGLISVIAAAGWSLGNIAGPFISMTGNVVLVVITMARSWFTAVSREVHEEIQEAEEYLSDLIQPQAAQAVEAERTE